jgi:hypothetical protein
MVTIANKSKTKVVLGFFRKIFGYTSNVALRNANVRAHTAHKNQKARVFEAIQEVRLTCQCNRTQKQDPTR